MSITKYVKAHITFAYEDRGNPNLGIEERPVLTVMKITKDFQIFHASTYLRDKANPSEVTNLIGRLSQGVDEAFKLFNSLGKKHSELRMDIWVTRDDSDDEYHLVGIPRSVAFWATKSYSHSKTVSIRRSLPGSVWSSNPVGTDENQSFQFGAEVNKLLAEQKRLLLSDAILFLEEVIIKPYTEVVE